MKITPFQCLVALMGAAMTISGCDIAKSLVERRSSEDGGAIATDKNSNKTNENPGFTIDDDGVARLPPPSDLQLRQGAPVSTTELSTAGAKSPRPGNNWIFDKKSKNGGAFLISAPSAPNIKEADIIRRIDLDRLAEHDYDTDAKGIQGSYIYVPDEMRASVPSKYVNGEGILQANICAIIPGPENTVIAMVSGTSGGVAFVLNPYEDAQAFTPIQAIKLPYASTPCRAVYSNVTKKIYAVDVVATEKQNGQQGIYVADVYPDKPATTATYYAPAQSQRINSHSRLDFQAVELYNDVLYLLSGNGRFDAEYDVILYRVPLNKAGEPLFENMQATRTNNPIHRADHCPLSPYNLSALKALDVGAKPTLLTTGTDNTVAWDISSDIPKKIDMNPKKPGIQNIPTVENGQGGNRLAFSPDGRELLLLPRCRSNNKVKVTSDYIILGMYMTSFATDSLKQNDPIDMAYQDLHKALKNAKYHAQTDVDSRDFAISPKYIGVTGSFDAGGDIMIIDRKKRSNLWFAKPANMKTAHTQRYGFLLGKDDPKFKNASQDAQAIIWIP